MNFAGKGTGNRAKGLERVYMTSYSTLMVIMALSANVSKLQPCEICLTSIFIKANGTIWKGIPNFLFYFNGNHGLRSRDLATIMSHRLMRYQVF